MIFDKKNNQGLSFSGLSNDPAERFRYYFEGSFGIDNQENVNPFAIFSGQKSRFIRSNRDSKVKGDLYFYRLSGRQVLHRTIDGHKSKVDLNVPTGTILYP